MHIETTTRYQLVPVRMATFINQQTSAGKDLEKTEPKCAFGGNANLCSHCGKPYEVTSKMNNGAASDPVIPLLGIYPKNLETNSKEYMQPYVHSSVIYKS